MALHENNCTNVWTVTDKRCIFDPTKNGKHDNYKRTTWKNRNATSQ